MVSVINATPRPLYPQENAGTNCIGGCFCPRTGLDMCGKSLPHRDSIPGFCSLQRVAGYTYYAIAAPPRNRILRKCSAPWSQPYTVVFFVVVTLVTLRLNRDGTRAETDFVSWCN